MQQTPTHSRPMMMARVFINSLSQRAAVCCSVLQYVAVCCSVMWTPTQAQPLACTNPMSQCAAVCCSVLQYAQCSGLRAAVRCSVLQCAVVCCSALQCRHLRTSNDDGEGVYKSDHDRRGNEGHVVCQSQNSKHAAEEAVDIYIYMYI